MEKEIISVRFFFNEFSSTIIFALFRQLLGIKNENDFSVDDPCSDEFYEHFRRVARNNALIYEEVFNTLPTDQIRLFSEVENYARRPKLKETDPLAVWAFFIITFGICSSKAHEKCKEIQGFVVEFPLEFLADDVLMPKWNTSEGFHFLCKQSFSLFCIKVWHPFFYGLKLNYFINEIILFI